jgi:hypothetical protein
MDVNLGKSDLNLPKHFQDIGEFQSGKESSLNAYLTDLRTLFNFTNDPLHTQKIAFFIFLISSETAEAAMVDANVRVIDVPIMDKGHPVTVYHQIQLVCPVQDFIGLFSAAQKKREFFRREGSALGNLF